MIQLGNAAFSGVFVIFSHHYGCVVPISCVVLVGNLYSVTIAKFFLAPFYTPDDLKQLKQTVFGRDRYVMENGERILAYDENITPEQEAILRGHNFREYPTIQELSEGKDSNSSSNFQANAEENSSADAKNSKQSSFSLAPDVLYPR